MMEKKNLLREITFLNRLIGEHKTQQKSPVPGPPYPSQKTVTKVQHSHQTVRGSPYVLPQGVGGSTIAHRMALHPQRRVLVKKAGCIPNSKSETPPAAPATLPPVASHSVYINPNFLEKAKGSKDGKAVHINPTFFKKTKDPGAAAAAAATLMCKTVHINPRLLSTAHDDQDQLIWEATHKPTNKLMPVGAHLDRVPELSVRTALEGIVPNNMVMGLPPNAVGEKSAVCRHVGENRLRKNLGRQIGLDSEKKTTRTQSMTPSHAIQPSQARHSPSTSSALLQAKRVLLASCAQLPQEKRAPSTSCAQLPQVKGAFSASCVQLPQAKCAPSAYYSQLPQAMLLASCAQLPQEKRAQSTSCFQLPQVKRAQSASCVQLPQAKGAPSASCVQLPQAKRAPSAFCAQLPQERRAQSGFCTQLPQEKRALSASYAQLPQAKRALSASCVQLPHAKGAPSASCAQLPQAKRALSASCAQLPHAKGALSASCVQLPHAKCAPSASCAQLPQEKRALSASCAQLPQAKRAPSVFCAQLPQERLAQSGFCAHLPQEKCAPSASCAQLPQKNHAPLASCAQLPQEKPASSASCARLPQAKHTSTSSSYQLPQAKRVSLASSTLTLTTPTRPSSLRKKYAFRSKTKLVKSPVSSVNASRSARFTPSGSLLLAVSRTKLVRLPGRSRRWGLSDGPVGTAVAATAMGLPTTRVPPVRTLRAPAGSTLLSLSRTKLVRLPERARRPSIPKRDGLVMSSSTPAYFPASALSSSSVTSATVTRTRYRLHRSSTATLQSPSIRVARKVCSKYKFRSITATAAFRLDHRSGKSRRIAQMPCSGGGVGSRYKVDHRAETAGNKVRAQLLLSPLRRSSVNVFGNRVWAPLAAVMPKVALSHKKLSRVGNNRGSRNFLQNSALVRIGGLLYKSSRNKLILSKTPDKAIAVSTKPRTILRRRLNMGGHVVYVRGDKFIMDSSGKTMQRVACNPGSSGSSFMQSKKRCVSRIDIGGVTYIQKSPNVLVQTNTHRARNVVSNAKQKSIAFLTKKMRKINTPCLFYRRFGRCPRQEKGRCELVHDPKYIDICKKFLQGKCSVDGCLLSHNVGPEKMPTCRFFLEGFCVRDNCPYLHVKVNDRAPICRNFLQGYCGDGPECLKRHILVCPEFDEKGACSKGKYCPYPHSSATRNPRTTRSESPIIRHKAEEKGAEAKADNPLQPKRKRYYEADSVLEDTRQDTQSNDSNEEDNLYESTADSDCDNVTVRKQTKIGDLPSFIAL